MTTRLKELEKMLKGSLARRALELEAEVERLRLEVSGLRESIRQGHGLDNLAQARLRGEVDGLLRALAVAVGRPEPSELRRPSRPGGGPQNLCSLDPGPRKP